MQQNPVKEMFIQSKEEFIKTGIGIILLFLAKIIIESLPMIQNITSPLSVEIVDIITAVILVMSAIIIYNLGKNVSDKVALSNINIHGKLIKGISMFVSAFILYYAFEDILPVYLAKADVEWIYSYGFLALFLWIIGTILFRVYNEFDQLLLVFKSVNIPSTIQTKTNQDNNISEAKGLKCNKCQTMNAEDDQFCMNCGEKLNASASEEAVAQEESQEQVENRCSECGAEVEEDSEFCSSCGTKVVKI
ncbi:zinc ribbon domain-containing protein [Serpentinicella sp. ANB-PHB4]|uniref:zinc ribbon domain-containing protein n=1 Tax=Serpentinicella sp. ANB-PHB4 TaxID=3074076 RepID=UPI00285A2552|nr:zinc ribbon domain-containing protein [Serpentinicella sp. ANB-PHB4]MDR5659489.1 zinc ribbon domain-containing protein [Serpentinicella sp. ANB-PHB4]